MKKIVIVLCVFLSFLLCSCEPLPTTLDITIHFETNGGNLLPDIHYEGEIDDLVLPTTLRDGFEFDGWYTDRRLTKSLDYLSLDGVAEITLYAKWDEFAVDPIKLIT